jgi:hypothetical protein
MTTTFFRTPQADNYFIVRTLLPVTLVVSFLRASSEEHRQECLCHSTHPTLCVGPGAEGAAEVDELAEVVGVVVGED